MSAQITLHWIAKDSEREQAAGDGEVFEIMLMILKGYSESGIGHRG
jgi:hypothetical protein